MPKEIQKLDQDILDKLMNPEYTGNETTSSNTHFPPVINILQSDKQYSAFGADGDNITKKMYGKLFIRKQSGNKLEDLQDFIEGTVIKIESGYEASAEVRDDSGNVKRKIVDSGTPTMRADDKESYAEQYPDREVKNMVKIILAPTDDAEAITTGMVSGENPFCVLTIKGGGWGNWFDAQKAMDQLALASKVYGNKKADKLFVTVFKFKVSSKLEKSDDGKYEWYTPVIEVSLNDPKLAYAFYPFVMEAKKFSLFNKVAQIIEEREKLPEPIDVDKAVTEVGADYDKFLADTSVDADNTPNPSD